MNKQELSHNDIIMSMNNESDESTQEVKDKEYMDKMVAEIYSTDNVKVKTQLTQSQALAHSKLNVLGDVWGLSLFKKIARETAEHYISLNRGGRKEFTQIASSMNQSAYVEERSSNIFEKLVGK